MRIRSIAKTPRNKRFDYTPRYYDPEKEKRSSRNITFERKTRKGQTQSIIIYALILFGIIMIILKF